jgi:UDP-N-acetylmuramate dehydrogenase
VVLNRAQGESVKGTRLTADSGLPMAKAATITKDHGLSGLEFGLAIPGTVGGAVWANAGAHESDVAARLVEASVLRADGTEHTLSPADLGLAYRQSILKSSAEGMPDVVTWATFELEAAEPDVIAGRLDEIRRWRQTHQPLGIPSAGSVFRNPVGHSAGRIIDELGLKGRRVGGAQVSPKHANFIVNDQAGTASDVRRLGDAVRAAVMRERGIQLHYEIVFAGDWSGWDEVPDASTAAAESTAPSA